MKHTALFPTHIELNGKIVEFAGWELPVYYTSIFEEHETVRNAAGMFDVSHLGRIEIEGPDSQNLSQYISTNDVTKLSDGKIQYSLVCNKNGGILDDILVYKYPNHYLLVVNASNTDIIMKVLQENSKDRNVVINNMTEQTCMIAVQGPKAKDIAKRLFATHFESLSKYTFTSVGNKTLSRTGYTGEDGFEITVNNNEAADMWNLILKTGKPDGLIPCGLGARDTLRLEAGNCLYGHEMDSSTNPFEAGLDFVVKLNKPDFIGKEVLAKIKQSPLKRTLIGLEMCDNSVPRSDYPIQKSGQKVGKITSGTYSPSHKKGIAMGYVPVELSEIGTEIDVLIRNIPHPAKIVQKKWR